MVKKPMPIQVAGPVDRISDLPDFIVHQILSFLPTKTVAKTVVLSKRWQQVCESYPNFDFCQLSFNIPILSPLHDHDDDWGERYRKYCDDLKSFTNIVDKKLLKFCNYNLGMQKFKLQICPCEPKFYSLVDKWIRLAREKHVKELHISLLFQRNYYRLAQKIFAAKSLTDLHIYSKETVFPSAIEHNSLVTLSLSMVRFDGILILDDGKLPCIKSVTLSFCFLPEGLTISCGRLEKLELRECKQLDKIVICAPNLSSVSFSCDLISTPSFFLFSAPYKLPRLKLRLLSKNSLHTSSFVKVKKFVLQMQNQIEIFAMSILSDEENTFDRNEASKSCLSPPYALRCLNVYLLSEKLDFAALMDGLLWSFHPEILSVPFFNLGRERYFLEFLCNTLNGREDGGCCSSSEIKCWRHSFKVKDVIVKDNEGIKKKVPLCWGALLKATQKGHGRKSVDLYLSW